MYVSRKHGFTRMAKLASSRRAVLVEDDHEQNEFNKVFTSIDPASVLHLRSITLARR